MGIALGHVYQLMDRFATEQKRKKLQQLVTTARSFSKGDKSKKTKKEKMGNSGSKTLTVNLNWFNYDPKKEKYTLVKESQGGGKRCSKIVN